MQVCLSLGEWSVGVPIWLPRLTRLFCWWRIDRLPASDAGGAGANTASYAAIVQEIGHDKNLFGHSIRWGLVSVCLCTMIDSTTAGSFTRGCAARDLQILMLIEEREDTNSVPAEKLSDAMLSMLEARIVCHEGRVIDAMALYDDITQSITPDPLLSGRRR
jgi:hypothetical protein